MRKKLLQVGHGDESLFDDKPTDRLIDKAHATATYSEFFPQPGSDESTSYLNSNGCSGNQVIVAPPLTSTERKATTGKDTSKVLNGYHSTQKLNGTAEHSPASTPTSSASDNPTPYVTSALNKSMNQDAEVRFDQTALSPGPSLLPSEVTLDPSQAIDSKEPTGFYGSELRR